MRTKTHWGEITKEDDIEEEYESEEDEEEDGDNEDFPEDVADGPQSSDGENQYEHLKAQIAADDGEFAVPQDLVGLSDQKDGDDMA